MLSIEESKYYVTKTGWIVGPAKEVNSPWPHAWALYSSNGRIYEIEGVKPEEAFSTELVEEMETSMNFVVGRVKEALGVDLEGKQVDDAIAMLAERIATLEKIVVSAMTEDVGDHKVTKVSSELMKDPEVIKVIQNALGKVATKVDKL